MRVFGNRFGWDRNYTLGVFNGWLVSVGDSAFNASVVMSSFAVALGASNTIIGLLPAIQMGGWMMPQLFVASRIRHLPRKVVVYRRMAALRLATLAFIVLATILFSGRPRWLLVLVLLALCVNSVASGISGLPWMEVAAKVVPASRRVGFFGVRNLYGGVLALAMSFFTRFLLASPLAFPFDYVIVFCVGAVAFGAGWEIFGFVDEPPDPAVERVHTWDELQKTSALLRQYPDFRAFLIYRVLASAAMIADPFFTPHAIKNLGESKAMLGNFLVVLGLVAPIASGVWAALSRNPGFDSRRTIRFALFCAALAPIAAAIMPHGAGLWFGLVFVLSGVAVAGLNIGHASHLLAVTKPEVRGQMIGLANTLSGMAMFSPLLGGWLADFLGYRVLFFLGSGLYILAWLRAGKLKRE